MEILFLGDLAKKGFNKTAIFKEIAKLERQVFPQYPYNINDLKKFYQSSNGYTLILADKVNIIGYLMPILFKNKEYL